MDDLLLKSLDLLEDEERNRKVEQIPTGTTGSAVADFFGKALWGAADELSFSTLGAYDMYQEAKRGDAYTSWQDTLSLFEDLEDTKWQDLTGWGRAGEAVGRTVGMLPSFGVGSLVGKGFWKGIGKVGRLGAKVAANQSKKELKDKAANIVLKKGTEKIAGTGIALSDDAAQKIISKGYEWLKDSGDMLKIEEGFRGGIFKQVISSGIVDDISKITKLSTNEAKLLADEVVEIITKNDPNNANALLSMLFRKIPGTYGPGGVVGSQMAGAAALDATIGFALGSMHAIADQVKKTQFGVEKNPLTHEYEYTGDNRFNWSEASADWWKQASTTGLHFSVIGPVKYFRGGTSVNPLKRGASIVKHLAKGNRPLNNMTTEQLKANITAINELSGGYVHRSVNKWNKDFGRSKFPTHDKWWLTSDNKELLKSYLSTMRKDFSWNAVPYWVKESVFDVGASLPRMLAGVAAMNGFHVWDNMSKYGFSKDVILNSLGETPHEKVTTIATAMWFTRKPHRLHYDTKNPIAQKIFQTDQVPQYMQFKEMKLRKIMASMEAFGVKDNNKLHNLIMAYGNQSRYSDNHQYNSESRSAIKGHLYNTGEFAALREIFDPYKNVKNDFGGTELRTAFNKWIADALKDKKITREQAHQLNEQLYVAERVLDKYHKNSGEELAKDTYTPDQAYDIIQKVSTMQFKGESLNVRNVEPVLQDFIEKSIRDASLPHTQIMADYLFNTFKALGLDVVDRRDTEGKILIPNVADLLGGLSLGARQTLATVVKRGVQNGWIRLMDSPPMEQLNKITNNRFQEAEIVLKESIDAMHRSVWGEKWEGNRHRDDMILENDAWHFAQNDVIKFQRHVNAFEILKNGKDHGLDINEVGLLQDKVNTFIRHKEAPQVGNLEGTREVDSISHGKVDNFIKTLHRVVKAINPDITSDQKVNMTYQQAKGLMEAFVGVEGQSRGLFGDLFTNKESLREFTRFVHLKSIDNLGMRDFQTGIDTKASLTTLIRDIDFNKAEGEGSIAKLISYERIKATLDLELQTNKISEDTYNDLIKHYEYLLAEVKNSSFPIEFSEIAESTEGAYRKALIKSMAIGKSSLDLVARDKSRIMEQVLLTEINRLDQIIHTYEIGGFNIDTPKSKDGKTWEVELQEYVDARDNSVRLKDIIKTALDHKDPYTLSAVMSHIGSIEGALDALKRQDQSNYRIKYASDMVKLAETIQATVQRRAINESNIMDMIREEFAAFDREIPGKDIQDKVLRITTSQFALKYGVDIGTVESIFSIDKTATQSKKDTELFIRDLIRDIYNDHQALSKIDPNLVNKLELIKQTLLNSPDAITFDPKTPEGLENFRIFVAEPLKLAMRTGLEKLDPIDRPTDAEVATDHYVITTNYFSKRVVKTLKLDARSGSERLVQGHRYMGETKDRGLGALLESLDPDQSFIYLAESSGINSDGRVIRNIAGERNIDGLNALLNSGKFTVRNNKIVEEIYRFGESEQLTDPSLQNPTIAGERFRIVPLNESTTLIVRVDKTFNKSIHKEIQSQFRPRVGADKGGDLFKILEAVYDGDMSLDTPQHRAMNNLLTRLRNADADLDVVEAIKLARMIHNMPAFIPDVLENGVINLQHDVIKDLNKRDKLAETKNGYIPTIENRARSADLYKNSESDFHQKAYGLRVFDLFNQEVSSVRDWFEPSKKHGKTGLEEYRKLKVLSFDDEGSIRDRNNNILLDKSGAEYANVFDALHRHRAKLEQQRVDKDITPEEYTKNLKMFEDAYKSIVDGEFFLTFDAYLAKLMMVGLHPDMVETNSAGEIIGFRSGALKPTVAQGDVNINRNSPAYGRIEQFFAKTAFKYNPVVEVIMRELGVDGLTFGSANKINSYKSQIGADRIERYSTLRGIQRDNLKDLNKPWTEHITKNNIIEKHIIEVPLESMSLRTISKEHDPLVGQNAGLHMNHNNGIAEWIGLDAKLKKYNNSMENQYNNIAYRSILANKILGSRAADGDPSVVNSSIGSILSREGLVLEPWAQRKLEDNMIGYFLNNGSIGGGVVENGSLDVMGADMGYLKPSVHTEINGRKTVRYYGEFLPSHYAASKEFIQRGQDPREVHSVIIQKVEYLNEAGIKRKADAYIVQINKADFVIVEGRMIDKNGKMFDIDSKEEIKIADTKINKDLYERMVFAEKSAYESMDKFKSPGNLGKISISDAARILKNMHPELSVGSINSRQPRNMMGDLVISRIAFNKDGNPYNNKRSGNVSLMNFMDAIKPQDADFDFDKSFNYIGAPGKFWAQTGKLAGEIVTKSFDATIMKTFGETGSYSKLIAEQIKGDADYTALQNEVTMARGRFIKMHQVLTYMSNIFREYPEILKFKINTGDKAGQYLTLKLGDKGRYISTVKNVSVMAEKFIDMYKNMPSKDSVRAIQKLQNTILFGPDGMFEIGIESGKRIDGKLQFPEFTKEPNIDLNAPMYREVRDAINRRMILPLNEYVRLNRGYGQDAAGQDVSARLQDYHNAFDALIRNITNDPFDKVSSNVEINVGLTSFRDYFDMNTGSKNPYDVAMRQMHSIYLNTVAIKEKNNIANTSKQTQEILDYIEGGYKNVPGMESMSSEARHNKIFNDALNEYVKDGWRMLRLQDLVKQEKSLTMQIQQKEIFASRSKEETIEVRDMKEKLRRIQDLRVGMEEALAYMFSKDMDAPAFEIKKVRDVFSPGKYMHNSQFYDKPVVIVDKTGKIKEVIQTGQRNIQTIFKTDKMILNGRRFEVSDGQQQQGLAILYKAFAGMPRIRINGEMKELTHYEIREYITKDYNDMVSDIINVRPNKRTLTAEDRAMISLKVETLLHEHIFGTEFAPVDELTSKALVLRALTPAVSNEKVSIRSNNEMAGKAAVFDYIYRENMVSEKVMQLLAKIASGERNGDRQLAIDILNDVNTLKNVAWISEINPDVNIKAIHSKMITEPMSLEGRYTTEKHLNQDIYALRDSKNEIERDAARIMIDYAQGKGLVDPVSLYKASRVMVEKGISVIDQWGRIKYLSNADGSLKKWGADQIFIRDVDRLKSKNLGEKAGVEQSTKERIMNDYDCNALR